MRFGLNRVGFRHPRGASLAQMACLFQAPKDWKLGHGPTRSRANLAGSTSASFWIREIFCNCRSEDL